MRQDHSLEEARAKRQHRLNFVMGIVAWVCLNDIVLFALVISLSKIAYALLFLVNAPFVYIWYSQWTDTRYKHLREKERKRKHFHPLPAPKEPSNPT